jgi:hypothetical protein
MRGRDGGVEWDAAVGTLPRPPTRRPIRDVRSRYGFAYTETCEWLSLVNASRIEPLHRSRNAMPAMRAAAVAVASPLWWVRL